MNLRRSKINKNENLLSKHVVMILMKPYNILCENFTWSSESGIIKTFQIHNSISSKLKEFHFSYRRQFIMKTQNKTNIVWTCKQKIDFKMCPKLIICYLNI
jgi:hypothetical protein